MTTHLHTQKVDPQTCLTLMRSAAYAGNLEALTGALLQNLDIPIVLQYGADLLRAFFDAYTPAIKPIEDIVIHRGVGLALHLQALGEDLEHAAGSLRDGLSAVQLHHPQTLLQNTCAAPTTRDILRWAVAIQTHCDNRSALMPKLETLLDVNFENHAQEEIIHGMPGCLYVRSVEQKPRELLCIAWLTRCNFQKRNMRAMRVTSHPRKYWMFDHARYSKRLSTDRKYETDAGASMRVASKLIWSVAKKGARRQRLCEKWGLIGVSHTDWERSFPNPDKPPK